MRAPAPRVEREAETALDRARTRVAALVPLAFPVDHLRALVELVAVDFRPGGQVGVLLEELDRVHVQLGSQIFHRAHRQNRGLRMVRRAPRAGRSDVGRDAEVACLLGKPILVVVHVRKRRAAAPGDAARRPGFRLEGDQRAVLLCADLDVAVVRRTSAGDHQLLVAVKHQLDGLARLLGELRARDAPSVDVELRPEAAAHVRRDHVDAVGFDGADRLVTRKPLGEIGGDARDRLRRGVNRDFVVGPVHDLAVRLQAAVGDDAEAVVAFHGGVGALPRLVQIRALGVVLGGLDAVRLACLLDVLVLDPVGQDLEMHVDGDCSVASVLFGVSADR